MPTVRTMNSISTRDKVASTLFGMILTLALISSLNLCAETFVGPTSSNKHLALGTNEAMLVRGYMGDKMSYQRGANVVTFFQFDVRGFWTDFGYAFAGPGELILTNQSIIWFDRLTNSSIKTVIASSGLVLTIKTNTMLKAFFPFANITGDAGGVPAEVNVSGTLTAGSLSGGLVIPGPATITFVREGLLSYYITENSQAIPLGVLKGPTGNFELAVEKSSNLKDWFPVVLQNLSDNKSAFYPLRVSR